MTAASPRTVLDDRVMSRMSGVDGWAVKRADAGSALQLGGFETQWYICPQPDGVVRVDVSDRGRRTELFRTASVDAVNAYVLLQLGDFRRSRSLYPTRLLYDLPAGVEIAPEGAEGAEGAAFAVRWETSTALFARFRIPEILRFAQLLPFSLEELCASLDSNDGRPAFMDFDDYLASFGERERVDLIVDYPSYKQWKRVDSSPAGGISEEQVRQLAAYLNVEEQVVIDHHRVLVEDDALYAVNPVRGGSSVIVAADGSALWGNSSLTFAQLLDAFRSGERTPAEHFAEAQLKRSGG